MKIDADICYNGIFPIYQQAIGIKYLWKVISDIGNEILGRKVDNSDKIRDFTYGIVTIIPGVGTIFNLFLYIVVFKSHPVDSAEVINNDSEEIVTPRTEEAVTDEEKTEEEKPEENLPKPTVVETPTAPAIPSQPPTSSDPVTQPAPVTPPVVSEEQPQKPTPPTEPPPPPPPEEVTEQPAPSVVIKKPKQPRVQSVKDLFSKLGSKKEKKQSAEAGSQPEKQSGKGKKEKSTTAP